jgi:hypothetical protein
MRRGGHAFVFSLDRRHWSASRSSSCLLGARCIHMNKVGERSVVVHVYNATGRRASLTRVALYCRPIKHGRQVGRAQTPSNQHQQAELRVERSGAAGCYKNHLLFAAATRHTYCSNCTCRLRIASDEGGARGCKMYILSKLFSFFATPVPISITPMRTDVSFNAFNFIALATVSREADRKVCNAHTDILYLDVKRHRWPNRAIARPTCPFGVSSCMFFLASTTNIMKSL